MHRKSRDSRTSALFYWRREWPGAESLKQSGRSFGFICWCCGGERRILWQLVVLLGWSLVNDSPRWRAGLMARRYISCSHTSNDTTLVVQWSHTRKPQLAGQIKMRSILVQNQFASPKQHTWHCNLTMFLRCKIRVVIKWNRGNSRYFLFEQVFLQTDTVLESSLKSHNANI